jgi:hypothetical protein
MAIARTKRSEEIGSMGEGMKKIPRQEVSGAKTVLRECLPRGTVERSRLSALAAHRENF